MRADEMNLNDLVEFYQVWQVSAPGIVLTNLRGLRIQMPGDSQYADHDPDGSINCEAPAGWSFVNGYSGQQGYAGPIMHDSESLGGRMARDVLARPGFYCLLPVIWLDVEEDEDGNTPDDMEGWVLLYQPDPALDDDYTEFYS